MTRFHCDRRLGTRCGSFAIKVVLPESLVAWWSKDTESRTNPSYL